MRRSITERISVTADGAQSSTGGGGPSISGDGRFVAFTSTSTLIPGVTGGSNRVYIYDRQEKQVTDISPGYAYGPSIGAGDDPVGTLPNKDWRKRPKHANYNCEMREPSNKEKIKKFMESLGQRVKKQGRVYLTGGATAVLFDWRETTIDIDIKPVPESDEIFQAIAALKNELDLNIELASPGEFIPPLPGWEDRSIFIGDHGPIHFFHYDPYAQVLAKIERGHAQDQKDVAAMLSRGLIKRETLLRLFEAIRPELIRYPAIDAESFETKVKEVIQRG